MSIKKLIIIISSVTVVALGIALTLALKPDLLTGLTTTIGNTFKDTGELVGVDGETPVQEIVQPPVEPSPVEEMPEADAVRPEDNLKVYIPNTAGDFIVVTEGKDALVINGGTTADSENIKAYLAKLGIKKARYLVATNYLGTSVEGFPKLLSYLPADYILVAENIATQELDKAVVNYLNKSKLIWGVPHEDANFHLGKASFNLLRTHDRGSILVLVKNGNTKMLFSGTTTKIEAGLIAKLPTEVDLYSVTATNDKFSLNKDLFDKVNPKHLVVNDTKDLNISGVTKMAETKELTMYRSTQCGNIVVGSNGTDIQVQCSKK